MRKISSLFLALALILGGGSLSLAELATSKEQTFHVAGMHCGACAKMIEGKVCKLNGVKSCAVEVGKITLTSEAPMTDDKIQAALNEAGEYKLVATAAEATPHLPKSTDKKKTSQKNQ